MKLPLVSILIPTYNQPEYFRQALESAIAQDYPNIEIVVSDDSTDDRVKNVFEEYQDCGHELRYLKHNITYTNELVDERACLNICNLLENARGKYVNILLHDDLIYPRKISTMIKFFTEGSCDQVAIVSSARNIIDHVGNITGYSNVLSESKIYQSKEELVIEGESVGRLILLVCGNFVGELSTVLMSRDVFYRSCVNKLHFGYFLGVRDRTMLDISSYLECLKDGKRLVYIPEPLSAFRMPGMGINEDQSTYNGDARFNIIVDWLSFVTIAYMNDIYIHSSSEFIVACNYWHFIAEGMIRFFKDFPNAILNVETCLIDQMMQAIESVEQKNFDLTLKIGTQWIQKFSSETFETRKLQ